jgi:hypothetical protein
VIELDECWCAMMGTWQNLCPSEDTNKQVHCTKKACDHLLKTVPIRHKTESNELGWLMWISYCWRWPIPKTDLTRCCLPRSDQEQRRSTRPRHHNALSHQSFKNNFVNTRNKYHQNWTDALQPAQTYRTYNYWLNSHIVERIKSVKHKANIENWHARTKFITNSGHCIAYILHELNKLIQNVLNLLCSRMDGCYSRNQSAQRYQLLLLCEHSETPQLL